jgi:hypothetical protein
MFYGGTHLRLVPAKFPVYLGLVERQAACVGRSIRIAHRLVLLVWNTADVPRNGRIMVGKVCGLCCILFRIPAAYMVAAP